MPPKVMLSFELFAALWTVVRHWINVVLIVHVYPKRLRCRGFMITQMTRVGFDSQMHRLDMAVEVGR